MSQAGRHIFPKIIIHLNFLDMSRLKQSHNIDSLITDLQTIQQNQCSLSEKDSESLSEALRILNVLKRKKGRTNEQVLSEIVKVFNLLAKFFR
jgi:hypothetical protein